MEGAETKTCSNCKREIPADNFMTHAVHCSRNIKVCPVCKEPVPHSELQEHHDKMHKLRPCAKCGESVCGTDMEDHVRDSCAHTIKSCRYCELELPRREIPTHEGYCGVRTEQCAECREWVMIKYRQLHLDSNHGFIRLDDDPAPMPQRSTATPIAPLSPLRRTNDLRLRSTAAAATSTSAGTSAAANTTSPANGFIKNTNQHSARLSAQAGSSATPVSGPVSATPASRPGPSVTPACRPRPNAPGCRPASQPVKPPLKRTNDQPQINTSVAATEKVNKDLNLGMSRGAVKKRPAPRPPADPRRDHAYYSALQRQQEEERHRREQSAINVAQGLPPVLNPLEKLERLRKMDALHNREVEPPPRPRPQPQERPAEAPALGHLQDRRNEFRDLKPMTPEEFMNRFNALQVDGGGDRGTRVENLNGRGENLNGRGDRGSNENGRGDWGSNVNGRGDWGTNVNGRGDWRNGAGSDRFSEIKSSLRELRRGLNEVTAPYNSSPVSNGQILARAFNDAPAQSQESRDSTSSSEDDEDVRLPCEFCDRLLPADQLVIHQTGCRPDLAQLRVRVPRDTREPRDPRDPRDPRGPRDPRDPRDPRRQRDTREHSPMQLPPLRFKDQVAQGGQANMRPDEPVIPCEFCTESLPVYLIQDHQEMCRREEFNMYSD